MLDGLMKELGLDGSSLSGLAQGATAEAGLAGADALVAAQKKGSKSAKGE